MVRGLKKPGDLLARSDLCHLHEGRAEAEFCAIDDKLQCQDRDVVLVARSGSNQHVWVVRRSLSEIVNGRLRRRSDASSARLLTASAAPRARARQARAPIACSRNRREAVDGRDAPVQAGPTRPRTAL